MKILISHGLFIKYLGGAETEIIDLVKAASSKGNDVFLVTNSEILAGRVGEGSKETHVVRWPNQISSNILLPFSMFKYILKLNSIVGSIKPDTVLSGSRYDFMAFSVVKIFHKFRLYFRDYSDIRRQYFFEKELKTIPKIVRNVFYRQLAGSNGILTQSNYDVRFIKNTLKKSPPVFSVHSGINLSKIRPKKRKTSNEVTVGTIARLAPGKGLEDFVLALTKIKSKNIKAIIVGDGESMEELEALAKDTGADVKFIGYKQNVEAYYNKIDIFIQPSLYEGWSRTVSEALAYGCALVVSDIPTLKEQVDDGKYGAIYKAGSADELALRIDELASNPKKIAEFSTNGPGRAKEISNMDTIISRQIIPIISSD